MVPQKSAEKEETKLQEDYLLQVENLKIHFHVDDGIVKAVDGIDFTIKKGKTTGVVGESGCGKSMTALSIMNMMPKQAKVEGEINFQKSDGQVVEVTSLKAGGKEIREIRGNEIGMIFQEPMTSFTPVYTIGRQIIEAILEHNPDMDKEAARARAIDLLKFVGIPAPEQRVDEYPHQFSGGMRQRAMIAMALSCNPSLLIADEPTTALDVTIEAQIIDLLKNIQEEMGMSIMIITHDLGVVGEMADDVIVMYMGKVVERASCEEIFYQPAHPYTKGLLQSIPVIGKKDRLYSIKGSTPNPFSIPKGCSFNPRCPVAEEICTQEEPPMVKIGEDHWTKCWLHHKKEVIK